MKANIEKATIVMAGAWNQQIISPKWLSDNGFTKEQNLQIEVAIGNPSLPVRFKLEQIYLHVSSQMIVAKPKDETKESYDSAELLSRKLLDTLNHTPIVGIGYNFQFIETSTSAEIISRFNFKDDNLFAELNLEINEKMIRRQLKNKDGVLNLSMQLVNNKDLVVDFNWHYNSKLFPTEKYYEKYLETRELIKKYLTIELEV